MQAGAPLAGVRAAVQNDETLWELLDTPLMLSVAALAYYGTPTEEVVLTGTSEEKKSQLFANYTDAMFNRRGKSLLYPRHKTIQWLSWLAVAMSSHNQSVFYVEWMQPSWLSSKLLQQRLVNLGACVLSGLSGALIGGLLVVADSMKNQWLIKKGIITSEYFIDIFELKDDRNLIQYKRLMPDNSVVDGLLSEALNAGFISLWIGCFIGLIVILMGKNLNIRPIEIVRWDISSVRRKWGSLIMKGARLGLMWGGLIFGLIIFLLELYKSVSVMNLIFALLISIGVGLIGVIPGGLINLFNSYSGALVHGNILTRELPSRKKSVWKGMLFGWLIVGLIVFFYMLVMQVLELNLIYILIVGIAGGLVGAILGGLFNLFSGALVQGDITARQLPNEGITRSYRNAFLFLGLYCVLSGILIQLLGILFFLPSGSVAMIIGMFGLYGGLRNGGIAFYQHLTLRFLIYFRNLAPWHYIRFLDYAVERVFLRKVGGGYVFAHRLLLEYFSKLYTIYSPKKANNNTT